MPSKYTNPTVDNATLSGRTQDIEPPIDRVAPENPSVTGAADGTDYFYFDLKGHKGSVTDITVTNPSAATVTFTVEASAQDDGTAIDSATYRDVTVKVFGVASIVLTAAGSASFLDAAGELAPFKFFRIVYVISGASSDVDLAVNHRRIGV